LALLLNKVYPLAKITGVDIDPKIVELGKKYLKLDTVKVNVVISDAMKFVKKEKKAKKKLHIVRTYSAGVFFGRIINRPTSKEVVMRDARRLWYWDGAASLSQLAMEGVKCPYNCKFPCSVEEVILTEVIEILLCSDKAIASINAVPIWGA